MMSTFRRALLGVSIAVFALYLTLRPRADRGASPRPTLSGRPAEHRGEAPGAAKPRAAAESRAQAEPSRETRERAAGDEAALMASLRESFMHAPLETLERARKAQSESKDSAHAAERSWIIVRSLVNLQRFHEAREEAKLLVARDPGNPWAIDVQRHLLVNPLDYPSREELQELAKAETQP